MTQGQSIQNRHLGINQKPKFSHGRMQMIDTRSWKQLLAAAMVEKLGIEKALEIAYAAQQKGSRAKLVVFIELLKKFGDVPTREG